MRQSKRFQKWFKQYGYQLPDKLSASYIIRFKDTKRMREFIEELENRAYRRGLEDGRKSDLLDLTMESVLELGQSMKDMTDKCLMKISRGRRILESAGKEKNR